MIPRTPTAPAPPGGGAGRPLWALLAAILSVLVFAQAGAAVLCAVPLVVHLRSPGAPVPAGQLPLWATVALLTITVAFGLLHLPLYGWTALPTGPVVGLLLGGLRLAGGGWGPPAMAHTAADLAGWWPR